MQVIQLKASDRQTGDDDDDDDDCRFVKRITQDASTALMTPFVLYSSVINFSAKLTMPAVAGGLVGNSNLG